MSKQMHVSKQQMNQCHCSQNYLFHEKDIFLLKQVFCPINFSYALKTNCTMFSYVYTTLVFFSPFKRAFTAIVIRLHCSNLTGEQRNLLKPQPLKQWTSNRFHHCRSSRDEIKRTQIYDILGKIGLSGTKDRTTAVSPKYTR